MQVEAERYRQRKFSELQENPGGLLSAVTEDGREVEYLGIGADHTLPVLYQTVTDENWLPPIEAEAKKIADGYGTKLDSAQNQELCLALTLAQIDAIERLVTISRGGIPPVTPILNTKAFDPLTGEAQHPTRLPARKGSAIRIRLAAEHYMDASEKVTAAGWTKQTHRQTRVSLRLFGDFMKDAQLDTVTKQDVAAFLDTIAKLNPKYGKGKKDEQLEFDALLKKYPAEIGNGLSIKTLKRHCGALAGFFDWAMDEKHVAADNPARGHRFFKRKDFGSTKKTRKPFAPAELRALFDGSVFSASYDDRTRPQKHTVATSLHWLILIALFTGMRLDEICSLRLADIGEENGIEYFNVTSYDGHRLKTPASHRRVPIHSALVQLGLDDYLAHISEGKCEFLLPNLKPGGPDGKRSWYVGKRFTAYKRELGIPEGTVFHSLRRNVSTSLEQASVPENEAAALLGHDNPRITYGVYSQGLTLKGLKAVVEKIEYPNLDLSLLRKPSRRKAPRDSKKDSRPSPAP